MDKQLQQQIIALRDELQYTSRRIEKLINKRAAVEARMNRLLNANGLKTIELVVTEAPKGEK